jgi:UDP-N-acetylmuramoylalanine--D-glutamate ligase
MSAGVEGTVTDRVRFEAREPALAGCRVLVVGAGRSGLAAARLAAARGARVTLVDDAPAARLVEAAATARRIGLELRCGGHPPELADAADLIVVSPGVPTDVPLLVRARERGLPVWGEIELATRFCRGRIVGVTGSNGKSTVTSMIGAMLRRAGIPGGTGGNLGTPLCDLLEQDEPAACHAVELSSFQLETAATLRADVAVVLNLSPDHLDRHPSLDAYAQAKARLLELQAPTGRAVLNADDPESARFRPAVRGRLHLFSTRGEPARGAFVRSGHLTLRTDLGDEVLLAASDLTLPGEHNLANALAASLAGRLAGCATDAIRDALRAWRPLPHRLERVAERRGVLFYDDSKATNPASAACALAAFPAGTVHLILGGRDKHADWTALAALVRARARRVLLVGEAAPMLERLLAGSVPLVSCGTVARAVADAARSAVQGEVVLLAPGCASLDQYRDYAERGEDFRRTVLGLPEAGDDRG